MIVCSYPGIGASTLCKKHPTCIKLMPSAMFIDDGTFTFGIDQYDWVPPYVSIIMELNRQDYTIFAGAELEVVKEIASRTKDAILVHPSIEMKDKWQNRLEEIYKSIPQPLDVPGISKLSAWANLRRATVDFTETIKKYSYIKIQRFEIHSMEYNLEDIVLKHTAIQTA